MQALRGPRLRLADLESGGRGLPVRRRRDCDGTGHLKDSRVLGHGRNGGQWGSAQLSDFEAGWQLEAGWAAARARAPGALRRGRRRDSDRLEPGASPGRRLADLKLWRPDSEAATVTVATVTVVRTRTRDSEAVPHHD